MENNRLNDSKWQYRKGLVSLVTPGWNGVMFIHRLLDSIISQTYRPIEYIYVDDGSTDGTSKLVQQYADKFKEAGIIFRFIRQENKGMCAALMNGWQYVTGEFLSNPEYDDILLPTSVETRVGYLNTHTDCAVVVADAWRVSEGNLAERKSLLSNKNPNRFDRNHFYQCLMSNTIFNAACYMVRMEQFDLTHPNRKVDGYKYGCAQQVLLPLYYHYNRGFIETPQSLFVLRQGSLSSCKTSLQEKIEQEEAYQAILLQTLDRIEMPNEDRELYKNKVRINVSKDYILWGYQYGDKQLFNKAYSFLARMEELSPREERLRRLIDARSYSLRLRLGRLK